MIDYARFVTTSRQESKLKPHSFSSSETERVGCTSTSLLLSLLLLSLASAGMAARMTAEESASHQIFDVDSSAKASSWEAESSWKTSSTLLELLLLRILISSHVINPLSFGVLKQLIGIDHLLELFLSPRVLLISIRVILFGSLLEPRFDHLLIGLSRNAQHLVWVWNLGDDCQEERKEDKQQDSQFVHLTCEQQNDYYHSRVHQM